jgi:hypothetical protein
MITSQMSGLLTGISFTYVKESGGGENYFCPLIRLNWVGLIPK